MKILIIRHAYFPDDPRDRKQAYSLVEAGHSVDIVCLCKIRQKISETLNGVRIFRIPIMHKRYGIMRYFVEYFSSFLIMSILVSFLFLKNRYNCIQVSTMPDFLVFTTLVPKLCRVKIILDLHEPTPELWVTKSSNRLPFLFLLQKKIETLSIKYANRCITVTKALKDRFEERGASANKITVIPNVCEEAFENALYSIQNQRQFIRTEKLNLITHGIIEERYGHELVIKALTILKKNMIKVQYDIIGEGEYTKILIDLVQKFDCQKMVEFYGYIPFDKLLQKLLEAGIGIIPMKHTPYSELVDTNKMYEFIALKKPIIISRLPAVEQNFDDTCVMFFEPGNYEDLARCIIELYDNIDKRHELAENAYARYKKLRWAKIKKEYIKIFETQFDTA